jgi:hypothetical protein
MSPAPNHRWQATRACAFALTRLLLPAAYLAFVGFYPIRWLDLGIGAAVAWLFVSVLLVPAALVIAFVTLGRRGRQRARRHAPSAASRVNR